MNKDFVVSEGMRDWQDWANWQDRVLNLFPLVDPQMTTMNTANGGQIVFFLPKWWSRLRLDSQLSLKLKVWRMWRQVFWYENPCYRPYDFCASFSLPLNDDGWYKKNHRIGDGGFRIKTFVSTSVKLWASGEVERRINGINCRNVIVVVMSVL